MNVVTNLQKGQIKNMMLSLNNNSQDEKFWAGYYTYPCSILGRVVGSKNCQGWPSANSNLLDKGHQVVWNSTGVFTNVSTGMSTHWIEVPKQYDFPIWIWSVNIAANFFDEKLKGKEHIQNHFIEMYSWQKHLNELQKKKRKKTLLSK